MTHDPMIQTHRVWGHEFLFNARSPGAGWDWYDVTVSTSEPAKPGGNWNLPLRSMIRTGDVVIDAGANVGWTTVVFARQVGPAGRVIAIEADPVAVESLRENVARNHLENVEVVHAAVWETSGPSIQFAAQVCRPNGVGIGVPTVMLDDFVDRRPSVVKLDVEGAEVAALRGAEALLVRGVRFEVELHARPAGVDMRREFGHQPDEILEIFRQHGYRVRHQRAGLDPATFSGETGGVMWATRGEEPPCE